MASPHVAGVAAKLWSMQPDLTIAQLKRLMLQLSTPDVVSRPGTGPIATLSNRLFSYFETTAQDLPTLSFSLIADKFEPANKIEWNIGERKSCRLFYNCYKVRERSLRTESDEFSSWPVAVSCRPMRQSIIN
jgi:hypothetical protein